MSMLFAIMRKIPHNVGFVLNFGTILSIFTFVLIVVNAVNCSRIDDLTLCTNEIIQIHLKAGFRIHFLNFEEMNLSNRSLQPYINICFEEVLKSTMDLYISPIQIFTSGMSPIPVLEREKNPDSHLLIFWLHKHSLNYFTQTLALVASLRIVGSETKIIITAENLKLESLIEIFNQLWVGLKSLFCCVLLKEGNSVYVYNFSPFRNMNGYLVNVYREGFLLGSNIFPTMPLNFEGYILNAAFLVRPPYVLDTPEPGLNLIGPEPKIILNIAQLYNISVNLTEVDETKLVAYQDGEYGIWKMISDNVVDIGIFGTTVFPDRYAITSPLMPYYIDMACIFTPKLEKERNWRGLLAVFSPNVWCLIIIIYLSLSVTLFIGLKTNLQSLYDVLYLVFRIHLETPRTIGMTSSICCSLLSLVFFYCMILTNSFKSKITTITIVPERPIELQSLAEVSEQNLIIFHPPVGKLLLNLTNHEVWNRLQVFADKNITYLTEMAIVNKKGALFLVRKHYLYLVNNYFKEYGGDSVFSMLPEEQYMFPLFIYMSPGHPLFPLFNRKLLELLAGGFPEYWLNSASRKFLNRVSKAPSVLTFDEVTFIFHLYALSLFISTITFIAEGAWFRSRRI